MANKVHFVGDGLPPRKVYLDGSLVESPIYADENLGFVKCHERPFRVDFFTGELAIIELKGRVKVEFIYES